MKPLISTVNYHLWKPCNMRCKMCYATFKDFEKSYLPKGHLSETDSLEIIKQIADFGFEKINFAGGEPTLCKWLPDLVKYAKSLNLKTSIVTNGWHILNNKDYLKNFEGTLDIIGLSIDSLDSVTNIKSGRAHLGNEVIKQEDYKLIANLIKNENIFLKINTVVSKINHKEIINYFINEISPNRWKILQMLPVIGQNDKYVSDFKITDEEFGLFLSNNLENLNPKIKIVYENNNIITGSYIMIDPSGRFFDNIKGCHTYSEEILTVGLDKALKKIQFDENKYFERDGKY